jgi:hypothetical protein
MCGFFDRWWDHLERLGPFWGLNRYLEKTPGERGGWTSLVLQVDKGDNGVGGEQKRMKKKWVRWQFCGGISASLRRELIEFPFWEDPSASVTSLCPSASQHTRARRRKGEKRSKRCELQWSRWSKRNGRSTSRSTAHTPRTPI